MGPGCAVKAILGRYFSLTVFGFAQVAMDIEVLVRIFVRTPTLHGFSHTYLGATVIGLVSLFAGRPLCQRLLNPWPALTPGAGGRFIDWLRGPHTISWTAAITGAFIGTYSHILLDSIMHTDMHPYAPFAEGNDLLGLVSLGWLHLFCIASAVVGYLTLLGVFLLFGRRRTGSRG
jgi:hypothetical protein